MSVAVVELLDDGLLVLGLRAASEVNNFIGSSI